MVAPEVDMATIRFPTIIVFYLSEFRGSEGSLRYHVRGFETVKELHESTVQIRQVKTSVKMC